jgi:hypothetical protein
VEVINEQMDADMAGIEEEGIMTGSVLSDLRQLRLVSSMM